MTWNLVKHRDFIFYLNEGQYYDYILGLNFRISIPLSRSTVMIKSHTRKVTTVLVHI